MFLRRTFELKVAVWHVKGKFSTILWAYVFLKAWSGINMMLGQTQEKVHIWTDASRIYFCGTWDSISGEWIQNALGKVGR